MLRDTVSAAETALTTNTSTWASFLSNHHPIASTGGTTVELDPAATHVDVAFDFKNASTDTCGCEIYGTNEKGPIVLLGSIDTVTSGTYQSDFRDANGAGPAATRYLGGTIATITSVHILDETGQSSITEVDAGGLAFANIPIRGYKYLTVLITALSASDNVRVFIREYS